MDDERKRLIESLIMQGKSYAQMGAALGISKQRAHQLCQSLGLKSRRTRKITGAELLEKFKERKPDALEHARRLIYRLMRMEAPVLPVIEVKLPRDLVEEFKAMPGIVAENFRAALGLYVIAITGGRLQPRRLYIGGIPRIRAITQEFIIERGHQPLMSVGARVSDELQGDFKALPGMTAHNVERALRLYLLVMKPRSERDRRNK